MTNKFYTADEIQADIGNHEGLEDAIIFPEDVKNTLLFVDLYSNVHNRIPNTATVDELKSKIHKFMTEYAFPICDFTGHEDKSVVVIEESGLNNVKLDNTYQTKARILFSLDNSLINKDPAIFNELEKFPEAQAICIVDFELKMVQRLTRNKN